MDFKTRKKYYNLCNPYEYLEPEDERNVGLDAFGDQEGRSVRGFNWADRLMQEIMLSGKPVFKLLTCLPGSGMTTVLKRLAKQLFDRDGADLFPVFIDAEDIIDLASPVEAADIILAVIYSVERSILAQVGGPREKALDEGYFKRFLNWLENTDPAMGKGDFTIPSPGRLVFEMKSRPGLRQRIRNTVTSHFATFMTDAENELKTNNYHVSRKFSQNGIVVIFDSFEKLKGITSNRNEVFESAEKLFSGNAPYIRLPVHTLHTVPPGLCTRIPGVDFLPMIRVYDRDNEPYEPGIEAVRELIRRRLPDNILEEMFGSEAEERLDRLILRSGGYPRDILVMLRECIIQNSYPILNRTFEQIIARIADGYLTTIPEQAFDWLAKIAKSKTLFIKDEDHKKLVDLMLADCSVFRYLDDDAWFDLHPAVYQIPGVQKAIASG
ncbi:MAG: hypothetical protein GY795_07315 [Desulfobacterales bacterium]|nr:hypothetical protein [Desulfobacterales bacterium]